MVSFVASSLACRVRKRELKRGQKPQREQAMLPLVHNLNAYISATQLGIR